MATKKKKVQKTRHAAFTTERAQKLYKDGWSVSDIAQEFGYAKGTGNNRVRNALITAGVYKTTRVAAAPAEKPAAKRQPQMRRTPQPQFAVPNDPQTALSVCLRTIDVNAGKLKLDADGRGRFARMLMGMIATNFGVHDFQARRPVLVLDEAQARKQLMQVANA